MDEKRSQATSIDIATLSNAPRMMMAQAIIILVVAAGFYGYQGSLAAQSALFGGSIALLNLWSNYLLLRKAAEVSKTAPGSEISFFYIGAVQRFVTTLGLFALGMWWLKLIPLVLLAAFAIAQLGLLFKTT